MERKEFNITEYYLLLNAGYKFIELNATGEDIETSVECFKKVVELTAYKEQPTTSLHYVLEIVDSEVKDMLNGSDTDIFYIKTA